MKEPLSRRADSLDGLSNVSISAAPACTNSASVRPRKISRILSHSGDEIVSSPISSASLQLRTWLSWRRNCIDAFPEPNSMFCKWRSDTSALRAKALRDMP